MACATELIMKLIRLTSTTCKDAFNKAKTTDSKNRPKNRNFLAINTFQIKYSSP